MFKKWHICCAQCASKVQCKEQNEIYFKIERIYKKQHQLYNAYNIN